MSRPRRRGRDINGVLLLDKPQGMSSNDALQKVKRIYNANRAGHTGALDPLATGMLPICLGEATKFSQYLLDSDKRYRVIARLGQRTDTSDADGQIVEERPVTFSAEQLAAARELAEKLGKSSITVSIKAGEGGKAFGSVSSKELASAIASQLSLDIDKKKLVLPEPLKTFGVHEVPIKLHKEVTGKLAVKVVES